MPSKSKVKHQDKYKQFQSSIDPARHEEQLKEIEAHMAADAEALLDAEWGEEEMGYEEEDSTFSLSEGDPALEVGRIDLSFPQTIQEFENSDQCYPPSYYTLSAKEKLILLYAENFRKQFVLSNPKRRAMVLALPNECRVQKFVCTTIRPTAFPYPPLIQNMEEIAKFVADFIIYEPLDDPLSFPTRLISPDLLLRKRRGNSFEMATLLCSMLIGAGYPAMVVSGVARAETIFNEQHNVPYPYPIEEISTEEVKKPEETVGKKYKLRPLPDLESHLDEHMAEVFRQKAEAERKIKNEIKRIQMEELELLAVDRYHYRRSHAWVVIVDNAPWSIQPRITYTDANGDVVEAAPSARFIEPSTGFICETGCKQYILLDSVWNNLNYYVNKQKCKRISDMRWDLRDVNDWEHMLAGEPPDMRVYKVGSDENLADLEHHVLEEKHLDIIRSWVSKLHIGLKEFEERFPKLMKTVRYKGAIHERYSPYTQRDGKVMQLITFNDSACTSPKERYEYYENRSDHLLQMKYTYQTDEYKETLDKGRNDNLKSVIYYTDPALPKKLVFYSKSRIDSLHLLEIYPERIVLTYENRPDRCFYREFEFNPVGNVLKKVVEKYRRNTEDNIPANMDIAVRTFQIAQNKILLKFHYTHGALTASTIEYTRPPKPDYGKELIYDEKYSKIYKSNPMNEDRTALDLYKLLLEQLQVEERVKKQFCRTQEDIVAIFDQRKSEKKNPKLMFSIFDPLRNGAARAIRMKQYAEEEEEREELSKKPADFLAPYLVAYKGRKLTHDESLAAYNACLNELKTRYVSLLNNLQHHYEDLSSESKSLKRFLDKFENQFNNYDYDRLVQEAKGIELNKRMVQQRLTITHDQSQKKYHAVKQSLLKDPRLNLPVMEE